MEIVLSKRATKALEGLDGPTRYRIKQGMLGIPKGDIKPLLGHSDGRQRLRIGKYRIVFCYMVENNEEMLYIMDIGSRGDIYK